MNDGAKRKEERVMDGLNVCKKIEMAIDSICTIISWPDEPDKLAFVEKSDLTMNELTNSVLNLAKARERMRNVYPDEGFGQEPVVSDEMMAMMAEMDAMKDEIEKCQAMMNEQDRQAKDLIMEKKILMEENTKLKKVLMGQLVADDGPV